MICPIMGTIDTFYFTFYTILMESIINVFSEIKNKNISIKIHQLKIYHLLFFYKEINFKIIY